MQLINKPEIELDNAEKTQLKLFVKSTTGPCASVVQFNNLTAYIEKLLIEAYTTGQNKSYAEGFEDGANQ